MAITAISTVSTSQAVASNQATQSTNDSTQKTGSGRSNVASSSSSDETYDKMDLNKDGTVTAAEKAIYEITHPNETTSTSTTETDKSQGKTEIDVYA